MTALRRTLPALFLLTLSYAISVANAFQVNADASQQLAQAQALLQKNSLAEAEVALANASSLAPQDPAILTLLAKVKARLGESDPAISLFEQVAALTPDSAAAHLDLAIALSDAGKLDLALEEVSRAIQLAPQDGVAYLNRARILADLKRPDQASTAFALAARYDANNPDTFFYWALLERERGQHAHEAELLQRVVTLQPTNDKAWFLLGRTLTEQRRIAEAIPALRHAIALNPRDGNAIYMLARNLQATHPAESKQLMAKFQAVRDQGAALESAKRLGDQANGAAANQQWPAAISTYRQALATCGDCSINAALHKNLGLALCRSGDVPGGRAELEQSLRLDPNDPDTVKALAILSQ